ncbi:CAP domain-containing protein [Chloracidobacterium validum]|uniref:CAP domain-containing protein n=1 Tax=Chloracidobacterium validum TaxID=2821543 RepID=A0ABX8BGN8_9BACT|nr:CAP domain-containing protein [Chloracidobacterium validum]QUW04245.1 CAP domain-containing protein [Chloracidobacterium validum]
MHRILVCALIGWLGLSSLVAPAGLGPVAARPFVQKSGQATLDVDFLRHELLAVINAQRERVGAPPVALDELANQVAEAHARDMAEYNYLSHWNRDGWKPYMRYGLRGGTDYSAENVSMLSGLSPRATLDSIKAELLQLHQSMHDETPPNDGHRRTILNPEHTHLGLGFAVVGKELRMAQEFLSRYVHVEPLPTRARPGDRLSVVGQVVNPAEMLFYSAMVHHEPLPRPMTLDQLWQSKAYTLPEKFRLLKPKLGDGSQYTDGTTGEIDLGSSGRFKFDLTFPKREPGVYTTMIFVQRGLKGKPFPAASLCVWVE